MADAQPASDELRLIAVCERRETPQSGYVLHSMIELGTEPAPSESAEPNFYVVESESPGGAAVGVFVEVDDEVD